MRGWSTALCFCIGVAMLVGVAAAQGPGPRPYDPATVETVKGTVEEVKLMSFGRGRMGGGVHLLLNTGKETLEVHLGPRLYLEANDFEVEAGETVEVTGSRVTLAGRPALIAREIQVGEYNLELRTEDGMPYWARGRQAPGPGRMAGRVMGRGCACPGCGCVCGHHHGCGHCW